ncbi:hypothetical protein [Sphingomonas sp. Leaf10]|uniref:hypothetical protein n=1 Tax=Sphingomonas sp. Leaf10 TaxID=1735676 RepID=UPI000AD7C9DA|nr:hypothetical protein [Sphingomonas sp. Leaf10]
MQLNLRWRRRDIINPEDSRYQLFDIRVTVGAEYLSEGISRVRSGDRAIVRH